MDQACHAAPARCAAVTSAPRDPERRPCAFATSKGPCRIAVRALTPPTHASDAHSSLRVVRAPGNQPVASHWQVTGVVMAGPLLETKLHVPRPRRGLVARPRLSERLSRGAESALTLVSAPAGFGKTTLLTEWLGGRRRPMGGPSAWLSLDQGDNDPASFWTYLVAALRTAAPGVGAECARRSCSRPSRPDRGGPGHAAQRSRRASRAMSCWCSTTTTSSTRARCRTGWRSCWSTCPRRSTW